jgi:hypothetical protein
MIYKIFDNGGKTFDRYTILTKPFHFGKSCNALGLSNNCDSPQGFSQMCDVYEGADIGKEISWEDLPENVKEHALSRLEKND